MRARDHYEDLRVRAHAARESALSAGESLEKIAVDVKRAIAAVREDATRTGAYQTEEAVRLRHAAVDAARPHREKVDRLAATLKELDTESDLRRFARSARFVQPVVDFEKKPDPAVEVLQELRVMRARADARDLLDDSALVAEVEHVLGEPDIDARLAGLHVLSRELERRNLQGLPGVRARAALDAGFEKVAGELPAFTTTRKHIGEAARFVETALLTADEVRTGSAPQRLAYLRAVPMPVGEVDSQAAA
jgi:hypothetical protein